MTLNPMHMIRNHYSQAQDILSDSTKDRLVNVYRQGGTQGRHAAGNNSREQQVHQGQQDFLEIRDFSSRRNAVETDLDIHLLQQQQLRNFR